MVHFMSLRFYACCKPTVLSGYLYTEKVFRAWSCVAVGHFLYLEKLSQEYSKLEEWFPVFWITVHPWHFCRLCESLSSAHKLETSTRAVWPVWCFLLCPKPAVFYRPSAPAPAAVMDQSLKVTRKRYLLRVYKGFSQYSSAHGTKTFNL